MKLYKTKKFLVIDDYAEIRGSIKRMLNKFGAEHVDTAHNGEDAMEKCEKNDYDIILADFNLGEKKSGQQLLEEMRYRGLIKYTTLYFMITAETTREKVYSAIENQPDAYLAKPFGPPALQKKLDVLLISKKELAAINDAADKHDYDTHSSERWGRASHLLGAFSLRHLVSIRAANESIQEGRGPVTQTLLL